MNFRTAIQIEKTTFNISHLDGILAMGSCFTEHIGQRLFYHQFKINQNPLGISYNPISISKHLLLLAGQACDSESTTEYDGYFFHYDFHSSFFDTSSKALIHQLREKIKAAQSSLARTNVLILSFGTSIVYRHKKNTNIVNNCHKQNADQFEKIQLSPNQMIQALVHSIQKIKELNPELQFIFTLSPVRHLRFGMRENSVSKAALNWAINELCNEHDYCHYFPSYEIFMDDLRDYRFYDSDLLHPSVEGVEYVWNLFSETYFEDHTKNLNQNIHTIQQGLSHRPFHEKSLAHQKFKENLQRKINHLKTSYPEFCWNI